MVDRRQAFIRLADELFCRGPEWRTRRPACAAIARKLGFPAVARWFDDDVRAVVVSSACVVRCMPCMVALADLMGHWIGACVRVPELNTTFKPPFLHQIDAGYRLLSAFPDIKSTHAWRLEYLGQSAHVMPMTRDAWRRFAAHLFRLVHRVTMSPDKSPGPLWPHRN